MQHLANRETSFRPPWIGEARGCPFCRQVGASIMAIRYHETAEANHLLPDVTGEILACPECGIGYPSITFDPRGFTELYAKSLGDLTYLDASLLQKFRRMALLRLMQGRRTGLVAKILQSPLSD